METLPDVLLGAERLMAAQSGFDPLTSDHSFVIFASDYASARVGAALLKVFERGENRRTDKWYRVFNELPVLGMLAAVALVVIKPF